MEEVYNFHLTSTNSPDNHHHHHHLDNLSSLHHYYWPSSVSLADSIETTPNDDQIILPRRRQADQAKLIGDDDAYTGAAIKDKIASHPSFSKLLHAYIDCHKIGAPPDVAYLLDDILRHKNNLLKRDATCLGVNPELDEFMETFFDLLVKYKSDLTTPVDEATLFLTHTEMQLRDLGIDEGGISSEEEVISEGETAVSTRELKEKLLRKFGGHRISSLKREFTKKKKKKGKLPKEATTTLLAWWNSHHQWPYPTEGDKIALSETTKLDAKQINNWFINQRKRHWNPSESMQLAIMGGLPDPAQYIQDD